MPGLIRGPEWLWAGRVLKVCHRSAIVHCPDTAGTRHQEIRAGFINRAEGLSDASVTEVGNSGSPLRVPGPSVALIRVTSFLGSVGQAEQAQALGHELEQGPQRRCFFMDLEDFFLEKCITLLLSFS